MTEAKAIIFDLGAVVLDLAFERMVNRFDERGLSNFEQYFTLKNPTELFMKQEVGRVKESDFYDEFRKLTKTEISDDDIKEAWNLILEDFNPERMAYLEKLAEKYPIYLFSNTNDIHAAHFEKNCLEKTGKKLSYYFKETFYSHELGMRKPDPKAFEEVLRRTGLMAKETVFIDDNADNIEGAKIVGLQTIHLTKPTTILDLEFYN